jgi:hypothetical protein
VKVSHTLFVVAVTLTIAAAAVTHHRFYSFSSEQQSFSEQAWSEGRKTVAAVPDPGCALGPYAVNLLNTQRLMGKHKDAVTSLLGLPDESSLTALVYEIGQCHGGGWHSSELVVVLSASGHVRQVSVRSASMPTQARPAQ